MSETEPHLLPAASTTITLPVERLEQLRSIANKRNITLARLVDGFIDEAIAKGEITDELPGFSVVRDDDIIAVAIRGFYMPPINVRIAPGLVHVLEAASGLKDSELSPGLSIPVDKAVTIKIEDGDAEHRLMIGRHGRGVTFAFQNNRTHHVTKTTFSPGIALSLARMIRTATDTH